jgi:hypothetical protein
MAAKILGVYGVVVCVALGGFADAAQDKKRSGTLIGEIKSQKKSPNGKNVILEVLAVGEEKARSYRVQYDPKVKGPIPSVLKAVQEAKVGDRVSLEWVDTGEGFAIRAFEVLKKAGNEKK